MLRAQNSNSNFASMFIKKAQSRGNLRRYYLWGRSDLYFTKREMEFMEGTLRGRTTKQIAFDYNLSRRTVEECIENMRDKLCCQTKKQLVERILDSRFLASVDFKYPEYRNTDVGDKALKEIVDQ